MRPVIVTRDLVEEGPNGIAKLWYEVDSWGRRRLRLGVEGLECDALLFILDAPEPDAYEWLRKKIEDVRHLLNHVEEIVDKFEKRTVQDILDEIKEILEEAKKREQRH